SCKVRARDPSSNEESTRITNTIRIYKVHQPSLVHTYIYRAVSGRESYGVVGFSSVTLRRTIKRPSPPFECDCQTLVSMVMDAPNPSSGASSFLANLPSRGLFSSTVVSSNPGGMRVYVCDHDSSPPEAQHIKTNQQNILIRSLTLKKQRGDSSSKDGSDGSRKRTAEKVLDRASAKKANNQINTRQDGSNSQTTTRDFHNLTVERLRALLKAKGLSTKGKKA
ncbi:hypothetical protein CR513_53587, partial [Mucuna pruriens]